MQIEQKIIHHKKLHLFAFLCIITFLSVTIMLIRPAESTNVSDDCIITEHIHTQDCYSIHNTPDETVLFCNLNPENKKISHKHDERCFDAQHKLICPLTEYEHIHTDECYDENNILICGTIYHQHSEDCFHIIEENESVSVLECGINAHIHSKECCSEVKDTKNNYNVETTSPDSYEITQSEIENDAYTISIFAEGRYDEVNIDNAFVLDEAHVDCVILQYKNKKGIWVTVTDKMENIPGDAELRIEVDYNHISKSDISSHDNEIVYSGIPLWLSPENTGDIYNENGDIVASLTVENSNSVVTFNQQYLDSLAADAQLKGSFYIEGTADWREIYNEPEIDKVPFLNMTFSFEDNLISKYGDFSVKKQGADVVEEISENGHITHSYLKYELEVISKETDITIENISITDTLSTENNCNLSDMIQGNGYIGITENPTVLGTSQNHFAPYERFANTPGVSGEVRLENGNMKWSIASLAPGEKRTLVYYVELNPGYVGSAPAGILRNEAVPESDGFPKDSVYDEFIPKADVTINKSQTSMNVDDAGNGTISYKIVIKADSKNSYTITDALIKDSFRNGMEKYVINGSSITAAIEYKNQSQTRYITVNNNGISIPIEAVSPDEEVVVTYSVPVEGLYSKHNGDFSFSNHASFVSDESSDKLKKGYIFNGSDAWTTIHHNQWMRKLNGRTVANEQHIDFNSNHAYNYDASSSDETGFDIPQNAQEYIVIVNEDGKWNMSGANFNDSFGVNSRVCYKGYLKIEEFAPLKDLPENTNDVSNNDLLSKFADNTPKKTVWVNIDGLTNFSVNPRQYCLDNENDVYRLTYYAAIAQDTSNIKNIVIENSFDITGTIGIGDTYIVLDGVYTKVSSTLTGNASYDFQKESLFHEKKQDTSGNGDIYWLIRADGKLPAGLQIKEQPQHDNSLGDDYLVGIYMGDKDKDFSGLQSEEELMASVSSMQKYKAGERNLTYKLNTISSTDQLDEKNYAIFSRGANYIWHGYESPGFMKGTNVDKGSGQYGIQAGRLNKDFQLSSSVNTNEEAQMWHFERVDSTDKFYITMAGTNKYMNIAKRSVYVSDTPQELNVDVNDNRIKIYDSSIGEAVNWYGDNGVQIFYSGWESNDNGENNWHYIASLNTSEQSAFSYDKNGNIFVNQEMNIPDDKSLYIIVRTKPTVELEGKFSKTFGNTVSSVDALSGNTDLLDTAEYIYVPNMPLNKEGMAAVYYNADNDSWTSYSVNPSADRDEQHEITEHFVNGNAISQNGSGLYMEWLVNINWDGSLEGDVIITDYLDNKMEPVLLKPFWVTNEGTEYNTIPELEYNTEWTKMNTNGIPFYYNARTGELKFAVGNLHKSIGTNNTVVNLQLICRVTDPDIIFSGDNAVLVNKADIHSSDGTYMGSGTDRHMIRPAYSISKDGQGTKDSEGTYKTNKIDYVIEINPQKENLMHNSDTLPALIDEMSSNMELVGTVDVYEVVGTDENLLDIHYSIEKGSESTKIIFNGLPDNKHLKIKYKTKVKTQQNVTANIWNSASWEGYSKPSKSQDEKEFSYSLGGSVSTSQNPSVIIRKLDYYNNSIALGGAEFELRKIDTDGKISTDTPIKAVTDSEGKIVFNSTTDIKLEYDTVYQIKETDAPTEYVIDDTPRYFMVIKDTQNNQYSITNGQMTVENHPVDVTVEYCTGDESDIDMTVYNSRANITVNKLFQNEDGTEAQPFNGTYRFGLYYRVPTSSTDKPVQILSIIYDDNGVSYKIDGKKADSPEFTQARAGYPNFIYELDEQSRPIADGATAYLNGRSFSVSYTDNKVIVPERKTEISVNITNKEYKIYLPMTGGKGLYNYYHKVVFAFTGIFVMILTAIFMQNTRKSSHKL